MTSGSSGPVRLVVCDLDGVIRHFDEAPQPDKEQELGLAPGFVLQVAFEEKLLRRAVTGTITDDQWRASVVTSLGRWGKTGLSGQFRRGPARQDGSTCASLRSSGRFEHASRSCC
jgi:hypothetical protein